MNPAAQIEMLIRAADAQDATNVFLFLLLATFVAAFLFARTERAKGFVHYAPNLMTTLGIIGTFFGIVIGLSEFDIGDINGSIGPLLEGLKTAFITSLAGMVLAIAFKTSESLGVFARPDAEETPEYVSPEDIHAQLQRQIEVLQKLDRSISGDEDSSLVAQVRLLRSDFGDDARSRKESFDRFSAELWKQLADFAEMLSKSATEQVIHALQDVIRDFNRNLTEQFGENFKELNAAVASLVEWQENYRVQLVEMRQQYELGVRSISETEASVAKIEQAAAQIPVTMGNLHQVLTTAQHQLDELARHLEAFRDMRDRAVEAVPQIREQMDSMVREVSESVMGAGEKIVEASTVVGNAIVEGAKEFEDRVNRTNEGLTTASDQLANSSEKIREQLEDTFKDLNENIRGMLADVTRHSKEIGETLVGANERLGSEIKRAEEEVKTAIEAMQRRLESTLQEIFAAQTRESQRSLQAVEEQMRSAVARTGEAVEKQLEGMDAALGQELERTIGELAKNLAAITQRFTQDYTQLTSQMQAVVGRSSGLRLGGDPE